MSLNWLVQNKGIIQLPFTFGDVEKIRTKNKAQLSPSSLKIKNKKYVSGS